MRRHFEIIGTPLFSYADSLTDEQTEQRYTEQEQTFLSFFKDEDVLLRIVSMEDDEDMMQFIDRPRFYLSYIDYLAIKDGVDLVRFDNGNIGFVAYYTSGKIWESYMEVITDKDEIERARHEDDE